MCQADYTFVRAATKMLLITHVKEYAKRGKPARGGLVEEAPFVRSILN